VEVETENDYEELEGEILENFKDQLNLDRVK
jgi:hypothetical protein